MRSPPDARDRQRLIGGAAEHIAIPRTAMDLDAGIALREQGATNSCVLHAIDHGVQAVLGPRYSLRSIAAPYWWARALSGREREDNGCFVRDGFAAARGFGLPPDAAARLSFYTINRQPSADAIRLARPWRGLTYARIVADDRALAVRAAIALGHPVVGAWGVDRAFQLDGGATTIERLDGDYGHAMLVSGYDGARLRLCNSWGHDWRDRGRAWITDDVLDDAWELWSVEGMP